jgi:hypothetical protein
MALREEHFSSAAHDKLASGTIRNSISDISATFRETRRPNPTKDDNLQLSFILHRQFRPYKNEDPKEKQQKQSLLVSLPKLQRRISCHCNVPSPNSQLLPFSLPCARVNTSRSNSTKNKESKSSASETFDSSKTVNSSATTTHPWSTPTASTSPSKCRKRTKRTTTQHSCRLAMSPSAQYEQQPPTLLELSPKATYVT